MLIVLSVSLRRPTVAGVRVRRVRFEPLDDTASDKS